MSLSNQEKEQWMQYLTCHPSQGHAHDQERVIPEDYDAYLKLVTREKVVLEVPAVGVPVTVYVSTAKDKARNCPVLVNFHGGGFVHSQDEDDDRLCAEIAVKTRGIAVDVDYAVCPEYAHPVPFEQAYAAVLWAADQCGVWGADPERLCIAGHSAGGALVGAVSLRAAATKDVRIRLQIFDYAAIDNYSVMEDESSPRSRAFSMLYADGDKELLKDPFVSPYFAPQEMLAGQPKSVFIIAGKCPFRKANSIYGERLREAGVEVTMRCFLDSPHGFTARLRHGWEESHAMIVREIQATGL